jgi:hypothetical protein
VRGLLTGGVHTEGGLFPPLTASMEASVEALAPAQGGSKAQPRELNHVNSS